MASYRVPTDAELKALSYEQLQRQAAYLRRTIDESESYYLKTLEVFEEIDKLELDEHQRAQYFELRQRAEEVCVKITQLKNLLARYSSEMLNR